MQHCQPLMPTSQFQEMSKSKFWKMLISQFQKIFNQNFKKLRLVCWSRIPDCVNKYGIIMLINTLGSNSFHHGLKILLLKMQYFVSYVFSFISHLEFLNKMHSWLMDLIVRRKLEMEKKNNNNN